MNILLVSPKSPDTFWGAKHALRFTGKKCVLPPLGLLTVAAMLPADWQLKLVDMMTSELGDEDIRWADYVFVSAMYIQRASAQDVIDRCRAMGTKTVAGGPLFSAAPEEFDCVDHLVLGEAETTLPLFLGDLAQGSPKHLYASDQWADVRATPAPLWRLIDPNDYAMMSLQYSRGCPFNCDFCDVTRLFGNRSRVKTATQVIAELGALRAIGWRGDVFFVDDNLIGNKRHLKQEVLPALSAWMRAHHSLSHFNTQASIDLADDDELMQGMVQAGFSCVFVGIETPSQAGLSECNKLQNKGRDLVACVKKIQQSGMEVQGGFILGFDSDDEACFENCIRFIQASGIPTALVGLLNAPRGTGLYDRLARENRVLPTASGDSTDGTMNFVPAMGFADLLRGYSHVIRTIYAPVNYYARVFAFLRNLRPGPVSSFRLGFFDLRAFVRSIWYIGVLDGARWYYWRLLGAGIMRPACFSIAVRFAILGYHFRKHFQTFAAAA